MMFSELQSICKALFGKNCQTGQDDDPGNYKPIILTLIPGKTVEQVALENNSRDIREKVIRKNQQAVTKGTSYLMNPMVKQLDDRRSSGCHLPQF